MWLHKLLAIRQPQGHEAELADLDQGEQRMQARLLYWQMELEGYPR